MMCRLFSLFLFWFIFFFFNDPATTEIYTSDTLFPYTTLFRSLVVVGVANKWLTVSIPDWYGASHSFTPAVIGTPAPVVQEITRIAATWAVEGALLLGIACVLLFEWRTVSRGFVPGSQSAIGGALMAGKRSEEHTSELQSLMRI